MSMLTVPLPTETNPDATPCTDYPTTSMGTRVELACPSAPLQWGASSYPQGSDDSYTFDASGRAISHAATSDTFLSTTIRTRTTNREIHKVTTTTSTYDAETHLHVLQPIITTATTDVDANSTHDVDHEPRTSYDRLGTDRAPGQRSEPVERRQPTA